MLRVFNIFRRLYVLEVKLVEVEDKVTKNRRWEEKKIGGFEKRFQKMETQMNGLGTKLQTVLRNKK